MGYVTPLSRPYDARVLINTYVYTCRKDLPHEDFTQYYQSLLGVLQGQFRVDLTGNGLSFDQRVLFGLFNNTVRSLLQITNPWASHLEAGLLHKVLREADEADKVVRLASETIRAANVASEEAHWTMLLTLFSAIYGECSIVMTSKQLLKLGFDDSNEPQYADYLDCL